MPWGAKAKGTKVTCGRNKTKRILSKHIRSSACPEPELPPPTGGGTSKYDRGRTAPTYHTAEVTNTGRDAPSATAAESSATTRRRPDTGHARSGYRTQRNKITYCHLHCATVCTVPRDHNLRFPAAGQTKCRAILGLAPDEP